MKPVSIILLACGILMVMRLSSFCTEAPHGELIASDSREFVFHDGYSAEQSGVIWLRLHERKFLGDFLLFMSAKGYRMQLLEPDETSALVAKVESRISWRQEDAEDVKRFVFRRTLADGQVLWAVLFQWSNTQNDESHISVTYVLESIDQNQTLLGLILANLEKENLDALIAVSAVRRVHEMRGEIFEAQIEWRPISE